MKFIYQLLNDFKFARKKLGGTWYKVRYIHPSGFTGSTEYWTQTIGEDEIVLKKENYEPQRTICEEN